MHILDTLCKSINALYFSLKLKENEKNYNDIVLLNNYYSTRVFSLFLMLNKHVPEETKVEEIHV